MKILIAQTGFLGDLILSTPIISRVTEQFPGAEVWMLVAERAMGLLEHDLRLSGILTASKARGLRISDTTSLISKIKRHKFDLAISPHRSFRTALILKLAGIPRRIGFSGRLSSLLYSETVPHNGTLHGAERSPTLLPVHGSLPTDRSPPLEIFPKPPSQCRPEVQKLLGTPYVVISPGSAWFTKQWPQLRYRELVQSLVAEGHHPVLLGSTAELPLVNKISEGLPITNLAGVVSLSEVITLVANAKLLVCNDSMILHIGSAMQTPTVAVFCATSEAMGFGPWQNSRARVVERTDLPCKPCGRHGGNSCPTGTQACMYGVTAAEVLMSCNEVMNER